MNEAVDQVYNNISFKSYEESLSILLLGYVPGICLEQNTCWDWIRFDIVINHNLRCCSRRVPAVNREAVRVSNVPARCCLSAVASSDMILDAMP